jgi:hypothetical protein
MTAEWLKASRWFVVTMALIIMGALSTLNAFAAWAGAQRSSPAQVVADLAG